MRLYISSNRERNGYHYHLPTAAEIEAEYQEAARADCYELADQLEDAIGTEAVIAWLKVEPQNSASWSMMRDLLKTALAMIGQVTA